MTVVGKHYLGISGLLLWLVFLFVPALVLASNVTPTAYAWSSELGWVNFSPDTGNVTVTDTAITGYAWFARAGWLNLSPDQSGVKNNGSGVLSGSAWGEQVGWVNFSGVTINPATGLFSGQATGDVIGVLNFSCDECHIVTTWRPYVARSGSSGYVFGPNSSTSAYILPSYPVYPTSEKTKTTAGLDILVPLLDSQLVSHLVANIDQEINSEYASSPLASDPVSKISKIANFFKKIKISNFWGYSVFSVGGLVTSFLLFGWLIFSLVHKNR